MARISQNMYSPLPQSISDSDSEKELQMESIYLNQKAQACQNDHNTTHRRQNVEFKATKSEFSLKKTKPRLSQIREIALILSVLFCFVFIILFLWVIPCYDDGLCSPALINWESQLANVEFLGDINLIHGVHSSLNLAVLYKTSHYVHEHLGHGVVSFLGQNGRVAWNFQQEIVPKKLDCSVIDVNGNGICDCLLLDERGLKVLGTVSGEIIWHVHSYEEGKTICDLGFPIKIRDLNHDGISELMMVYKHDSLLIVCGKTGKALKNISLPCTDVDNLKVIDLESIYYTCSNGTKEFLIYMADIIKKYSNQSLDIVIDKVHHTAENVSGETEMSHKIIVDINEADCPNCTVKMILVDAVENKEVKTWYYENAYITRPKHFFVNMDVKNLHLAKTPISGFIFKLWQWPHPDLDNSQSNKTYITHKIFEQVILIVCDATNKFSVYNISTNEIIQLCFLQDNMSVCQPNISNQRNSLLIGDLRMDSSQELIMYSSSFKHSYPKEDVWELVSKVSVTSLELQLKEFLFVNE